MTAGERLSTTTLVRVACVLALASGAGACTTAGPAPASTSPGVAAPRTSAALAPVETGADGVPVPVSSGASAVDSTALTSEAGLPAAFGCTPGVNPITIPASTTSPSLPPPVTSGTQTVQPPATGTPTVSPAVVVCGSTLAGGEALYLWYAPTPEARTDALRAALEMAAHVHAGPNWVAGGMVDGAMGTVGGDVYR